MGCCHTINSVQIINDGRPRQKIEDKRESTKIGSFRLSEGDTYACKETKTLKDQLNEIRRG